MSDPINYVASPTGALFHADKSFVRAMQGPVGSGKSVAMCVELFRLACEQNVHNGVRKSRALVIRESYAMLKSTTIRTWVNWFGSLGRMIYDSPIRFVSEFKLADGTTVDFEVLFLSIDRPDDVKRLRSLEVSFAWINEYATCNSETFEVLRGRVGRFPRRQEGGNKRRCVILDTNPPPVRSYWYNLFEVERPAKHRIFYQPGGLIVDPDSPTGYSDNPGAENIENLPDGYAYYHDQVAGSSPQAIKVNVLGEYASTYSGRPVYHAYRDADHTISAAPLTPTRSTQLVIGMDFGLNPAAAITQMSPTGALMVLDELAPSNVTLDEFIVEQLKPLLARKYPRMAVTVIGDPSGVARNAVNKLSVFEMLRSHGISAVPAPSNDFIPRRDAVMSFLLRRDGFLLNSSCATLREGFQGGYFYKKTGVETEKPMPEKNHCSHIQDALQYACLYYRGLVARDERRSRWRNAGDQPEQPHRYI